MIQLNYEFVKYVLSELGYSVIESENIIRSLERGGFAYPVKKEMVQDNFTKELSF